MSHLILLEPNSWHPLLPTKYLLHATSLLCLTLRQHIDYQNIGILANV
jgi:hypothetical protein